MAEIGSNRPRELHWYHAGPMLFGDLGTSRLYVLGLAFFFSRHASFVHIFCVNIILMLVGACYLIICRKYPDGGGVYSSAKNSSKALAVIGGLMLCADYTVTASMSCLDAFRYLGVGGELWGVHIDLICTLVAIGLIGGINWFGPRGMGNIALVIAVATVVLTLVIAVFSIPHLHHMRIDFPVRERYSLAAWGDAWIAFTEVVLALSGIEAIANMTGVMVLTVRQTSRRAILPVLFEVVVLNLVLTAAMNALPDSKLVDVEGHYLGTDDMMNILAVNYVGPTFSFIGSFVFGALLLSAVNTAIIDLVAIQYMMGRDGEVPSILCKLNKHGVPGYALGVAMLIPSILLMVFSNLEDLAGLYSVGVVSAITINLFCAGFTKQFELLGWEKVLLRSVGFVMACILLTLLWNKPSARVFSMAVLNMGLCARLFSLLGRADLRPTNRKLGQLFSGLGFFGIGLFTIYAPVGVGALGFFISAGMAVLLMLLGRIVSAKIPEKLEQVSLADLEGDYTPKATYLLSVSKPSPLIRSVIEEARARNFGLAIIYVRELAFPLMAIAGNYNLEEDEEAGEIFAQAQEAAYRLGVPLKFIYRAGGSISLQIIKAAIDLKVKCVFLQIANRSTIAQIIKGDVVSTIVEQMPIDIEVLIRA
ncbi:MAG: amino acid transporter [Planctomycetes bacterium]|nr:amino acid transporter [Planctomycetota bacterium]